MRLYHGKYSKLMALLCLVNTYSIGIATSASASLYQLKQNTTSPTDLISKDVAHNLASQLEPSQNCPIPFSEEYEDYTQWTRNGRLIYRRLNCVSEYSELAIPVLTKMAQDSEILLPERHRVIGVLAQIKSVETVQALLTLLAISDIENVALTGLKAQDPELLVAVQPFEYIRIYENSTFSTSTRNWTGYQLAALASPNTISVLIRYLENSELKTAATESLKSMLTNQDLGANRLNVRRTNFVNTIRILKAEQPLVLNNIIPMLLEMVSADMATTEIDLFAKVIAIVSLGEIATEDAIPTLIEVLQDETNAIEVRVAAGDALAESKLYRTPHLRKIMAAVTSEDENTRSSASYILNNLASNALPALFEISVGFPENEVIKYDTEVALSTIILKEKLLLDAESSEWLSLPDQIILPGILRLFSKSPLEELNAPSLRYQEDLATQLLEELVNRGYKLNWLSLITAEEDAFLRAGAIRAYGVLPEFSNLSNALYAEIILNELKNSALYQRWSTISTTSADIGELRRNPEYRLGFASFTALEDLSNTNFNLEQSCSLPPEETLNIVGTELYKLCTLNPDLFAILLELLKDEDVASSRESVIAVSTYTSQRSRVVCGIRGIRSFFRCT